MSQMSENHVSPTKNMSEIDRNLARGMRKKASQASQTYWEASPQACKRVF